MITKEAKMRERPKFSSTWPIVGLALVCLVAFGAGEARALSTKEILNYKGADRQTMLIKGARKEGKLVI